MHQTLYQEYEAGKRILILSGIQDGRKIEKKGEKKKRQNCSAYLDVSDQIVPQGRPTEIERLEIGRLSSAERAERALQSILESFSEVAVEVRVDQRVQRRIRVPDPEKQGDHNVGARTGFPAQRCDNVPVNTDFTASMDLSRPSSNSRELTRNIAHSEKSLKFDGNEKDTYLRIFSSECSRFERESGRNIVSHKPVISIDTHN